MYVFSPDETVIIANEAILGNLTDDEQNEYNDAHKYCTMNWVLDFLYNPENLNAPNKKIVTKELSNSCGSGSLSFDTMLL